MASRSYSESQLAPPSYGIRTAPLPSLPEGSICIVGPWLPISAIMLHPRASPRWQPSESQYPGERPGMGDGAPRETSTPIWLHALAWAPWQARHISCSPCTGSRAPPSPLSSITASSEQPRMWPPSHARV